MKDRLKLVDMTGYTGNDPRKLLVNMAASKRNVIFFHMYKEIADDYRETLHICGIGYIDKDRLDDAVETWNKAFMQNETKCLNIDPNGSGDIIKMRFIAKTPKDDPRRDMLPEQDPFTLRLIAGNAAMMTAYSSYMSVMTLEEQLSGKGDNE